MDLYQSFSSQLTYNRMRDRLIDLSREYTIDDIVRLERLGFKEIGEDLSVALASGRWSMGVALTDEELDTHIRRIIRQLDLPRSSAKDRDGFIIGASWDGCGDDDEQQRESRRFRPGDESEMSDFFMQMLREGRDPAHWGYEIYYDADPEEGEE